MAVFRCSIDISYLITSAGIGSAVNNIYLLSSLLIPFFLPQIKTIFPDSFVKRNTLIVVTHAVLTFLMGFLDFLPAEYPALFFVYCGTIRFLQGMPHKMARLTKWPISYIYLKLILYFKKLGGFVVTI